MSEVQETKRAYKPGWQILVDSAAAILNLTDEELVMAGRGTLADNLLRQVWSRLEEIIPEEHEGAVVFEVLRAAARVAEVPVLSPNVVDFVVDRVQPEDLEVMLREGLNDGWRLVQFEKDESVMPPIHRLVGSKLAIIAETTLAASLENSRTIMASGELDHGKFMAAAAAIYGAMMSGPFGGRMMGGLRLGGLEGIMGDPIEVAPGEDLGDALRRTFPGHMVIEVGGPHAGLLGALLGRRGSECPCSHAGSESDTTAASEPACNCGTCPACMMRADSATEDAAPAEDSFGDQ